MEGVTGSVRQAAASWKSVFSAHVSKRRRAGLKASPDGPGGGSVALAPRVTRRVYLVLLSGSTSSLRRGATPAMHAVATKRGGPPRHDYGAEGAFRSRAHPRFVALERHFSDLRTFCSRLLGWGIGGWEKKRRSDNRGEEITTRAASFTQKHHWGRVCTKSGEVRPLRKQHHHHGHGGAAAFCAAGSTANRAPATTFCK